MTVLLLSCPDQRGIVSKVAGFIYDRGGNIVDADQHTDRIHGLFLQRIELGLPDVPTGSAIDDFASEFGPLAEALDMTWSLYPDRESPRVAILVSTQGHCLYDLLGRVAMGELAMTVAAVVSNHDDHADTAAQFGVPFIHLPVDSDHRADHDRSLLATLEDLSVDLIVLARYMQILPAEITDRYRHRVINIHHSFLPAFVGAKPYHQAHERGVKIIGATAHYATAELDEGPIICQDTTSVSHRDDVERLVQRGRDLEMVVLARAVSLHLEHRVLAYANRTVVFD